MVHHLRPSIPLKLNWNLMKLLHKGLYWHKCSYILFIVCKHLLLLTNHASKMLTLSSPGPVKTKCWTPPWYKTFRWVSKPGSHNPVIEQASDSEHSFHTMVTASTQSQTLLGLTSWKNASSWLIPLLHKNRNWQMPNIRKQSQEHIKFFRKEFPIFFKP